MAWRDAAASSRTLLAPRRTGLLTGGHLFKRESESSRPFFQPTGGTVTVGFGPQSLAREPESAGVGGGNAVSLWHQRDTKSGVSVNLNRRQIPSD